MLGTVVSQIPFMIAGVGVIGTLLGVAVTQLASAQRDRVQWERQESQELTRWERERQERQEQWNREDAARWERERYAVYSELLASIERWIDVARQVKPYPLVGRQHISREGLARLEEIHNIIEQGLVSIELLAPESIRGRARGISILTSHYAFKYEEFIDGNEGEGDERDSGVALDRIIHNSRKLRDEVRRDLSIEHGRSCDG